MAVLSFWDSPSQAEMHRAMIACHDSLFRYARALSRDSVDAEELVQECYRRALASARKPAASAPEELRRWMFVILRNVWKNELRARGRQELLEPSGVTDEGNAPTPEGLLLRRALQIEVRAAVDSLREEFREVIVLRDMEGLTYEEISQVLECPIGTVMSRLARARARLRDVLSAVVGRQKQPHTNSTSSESRAGARS